MPDGNTPIYKMVDSVDQKDVPEGFTKQDEIFLRNGPENWVIWTIDCYQLYLNFMGWDGRAPMVKPDQVEFVKYVMKTPGVFVINNFRYNLDNKSDPEINKHLIAKMFIGLRYKDKFWMANDRHKK